MMSASRFCSNLFFSFAGIAVVVGFVENLAGLEAGAGVFWVMPLLIAAMFEGQRYAQHHQCYPDATRCWKSASLMGTWTALCAAVVALFSWLALSGEAAAMLSNPNTINAFVVTSVPLLRIGYAIGLASVLKGKEVAEF